MKTDREVTDRVIAQGRALVRAIEALGTSDPTGPFERAVAGLLSTAYRRRVRAIVSAAPSWVGEQILSASERVGDDRAAVWMSDN